MKVFSHLLSLLFLSQFLLESIKSKNSLIGCLKVCTLIQATRCYVLKSKLFVYSSAKSSGAAQTTASVVGIQLSTRRLDGDFVLFLPVPQLLSAFMQCGTV